ncbi:MAG: EamA family transporter, partial [Gammaproteobacteria bacterium]
AFGLWTWGLTRVRASVSAVLLLVEILVASLVSFAIGRESFGLAEYIGAALLVVAVLIASSVAKADAPDEVTPAP